MIETRRATAEDVDALLAHVQAGFDSYMAFAPAGWVPPDIERERAGTIAVLEDEATWALLALQAGRPVGHVAFYPARVRTAGDPPPLLRERALIPGVAHFWQLFVLPDWWGRGVAPVLHRAAVDEMQARGYERARLYTPSDHVRAKRFYERRGWTAAGEEDSPGLRLTLTEYRLNLGR